MSLPMFCRVTSEEFVTVDRPIPLLSNARTTCVAKREGEREIT